MLLAAAGGAARSGPDSGGSLEPPERLRVLELFAGIGGMRLALSYAGLDVEATAVEVNQAALRVYEHNFGAHGVVNRDITSLPVSWFQEQRCRIWTMSPPCQPYTRQGNFRDTEDQRARPLIHVISVLQQIESPPDALVVENVRNFETSESCGMLLKALACRGYGCRGFLLSPRQFGFPNARQRFYLVAKLERWPFATIPLPEDGLEGATCEPWTSLPCPVAAAAAASCRGALAARLEEEARSRCSACGFDAPPALLEGPLGCRYGIAPVAEFLDEGCTAEAAAWLVPESTLSKESARCFDVVHGGCRHSLCFTKAYGKYVNGTGSALVMPERAAEPSPVLGEYAMSGFFGRLRYFSPREVARLLGFKVQACAGACLPRCSAHEEGCPSECRCEPFSLPAGRQGPQQARELWSALGNSLNPQVVALVCRACQLHEVAQAGG